MATIAYNEAGIDKFTIHEMLKHEDGKLGICFNVYFYECLRTTRNYSRTASLNTTMARHFSIGIEP